jgi:hypothetical protein
METNISCLMQDMGVETQNGGPHLLVLNWRAGGVYVIKDKGSARHQCSCL